jgi:hypothetical protein
MLSCTAESRVRRHAFKAAVLLTLAVPPHEASAIDRLIFEADEITVTGVRAANVTVSLNLVNPSIEQTRPPGAAAGTASKVAVESATHSFVRPTARVQARRIQLAEPMGEYRDLDLTCFDLVIREPTFACRGAHISARGGPTGAIDAQAFAVYDTANSLLTFGADGLSIAGGRAHLDGSFGKDRWSLKADAARLESGALRKLAEPWFEMPEALALSGRVGARVRANGRAGDLHFDANVQTDDFGFSNEEGTFVAEKVAAALSASGTRSRGALTVDARFTGSAGQTLAGPVLLDFDANPLDLRARGALHGEKLRLEAFSIAQRKLLSATGQALVSLGRKPSLDGARIEIANLEFPAAYTAFAQLALATSDFGTLQTSGRVSGTIDIRGNRPERVDIKLDELDLNDTRGKFSMADVRGDVHWSADATTTVPPSYLGWSRGSAYGLSGSAARLDFRAQGLGLELTRQARIPIFDGAVLVRSLAMRQLGQPNAEVEFDAVIEPISMPLLSKAFGWPELQGELSGRVPGLAYRNRELTVDGDLSARVFDGTVVGRNFRLRDPMGPWPRLFADVTARQLDLDLVTRTFSIGNITGRLDADLKRLELFNWSPVAFDARLYTSPGDRTKHLISQKAVTSISNVGGGGSSVAAALQSGVLRFFDDFRYDQIAITCQLRNEVCLMGGIEPAGMGYYIVKGRGIPRIDIIGNQGRVDWPQLLAQIEAGMRSDNVIVR